MNQVVDDDCKITVSFQRECTLIGDCKAALFVSENFTAKGEALSEHNKTFSKFPVNGQLAFVVMCL